MLKKKLRIKIETRTQENKNNKRKGEVNAWGKKTRVCAHFLNIKWVCVCASNLFFVECKWSSEMWFVCACEKRNNLVTCYYSK